VHSIFWRHAFRPYSIKQRGFSSVIPTSHQTSTHLHFHHQTNFISVCAYPCGRGMRSNGVPRPAIKPSRNSVCGTALACKARWKPIYIKTNYNSVAWKRSLRLSCAAVPTRMLSEVQAFLCSSQPVSRQDAKYINGCIDTRSTYTTGTKPHLK
jgi:hypothetical protein